MGMTSDASHTHEPAGGDGLLALISMAIIAVVTVEGLFIAFSSWWLMVGVLMLVIAAAIGVCASLVRLIDHDTPISAPRQAPAEPVVAARPVPRPSARTIAH
jgi:hypothetical protein